MSTVAALPEAHRAQRPCGVEECQDTQETRDNVTAVYHYLFDESAQNPTETPPPLNNGRVNQICLTCPENKSIFVPSDIRSVLKELVDAQGKIESSDDIEAVFSSEKLKSFDPVLLTKVKELFLEALIQNISKRDSGIEHLSKNEDDEKLKPAEKNVKAPQAPPEKDEEKNNSQKSVGYSLKDTFYSLFFTSVMVSMTVLSAFILFAPESKRD